MPVAGAALISVTMPKLRWWQKSLLVVAGDVGHAPNDKQQIEPTLEKLDALLKQTPEPVLGIIKSVLGFRQFSLRGLEKVRGE